MSVHKRVLDGGKVSYRISFRWQGKQVWELVGSDKRAAERLDAQRKRELNAGTYMPPERRAATTVGAYLTHWGERRKNRSADYDRRSLQIHVRKIAWFWAMALTELTPKHLLKFVAELKALPARDGNPLAGKTLRNIYGLVSTALRDARFAELTDVDPTLPRGALAGPKKRKLSAYDRADVARLLAPTSALTEGQRMFAGLLLLTGGREGEVMGLRWRDLDSSARPLWCLTIDHQYDDEPLKTDDDEKVRPRRVPVHPILRDLLERWRSVGWQAEQLRAPSPSDRVVPRPDGKPHTKSSGYKFWRRILELVGIENRSLHATRHTFITLARRGSGRDDVVEAITHNSAGKMIDTYNHWEWDPLCEVVQAVALNVSTDVSAQLAASIGNAVNVAPAPGLEPGTRRLTAACSTN